jgi:hypothetical protein
MNIQISRREVLNNLIRFKNNLLDQEEKIDVPVQGKRSYAILVNRRTGELRFEAPKKKAGSKLRSSDWEECRILVESREEEVHFRLTDMKGSSVEPKHLESLAVAILFETLDVLNYLASLYHPDPQELPENTVLEHLSDLHISVVAEPIESTPGWRGALSRVEAEKILSGAAPGTYLLRDGGKIVDGVAEQLGQSNETTVKLYVLAFVDAQGEVAEHLLVQTEWGWTVKRDESNLSRYEYHAGLPALIRSLNLSQPST